MAEIDPAVLNSLASKLDGLDLSDDERRILDQLIENAAAYEPDVEGRGYAVGPRLTKGSHLSETAYRLGSGLHVTSAGRSFPSVRGGSCAVARQGRACPAKGRGGGVVGPGSHGERSGPGPPARQPGLPRHPWKTREGLRWL